MTDDQHDGVLGRPERERELAERRYVAALAALDAASHFSDTLINSATASEADLARLRGVWLADGRAAGGASNTGFLQRLITEIRRLMPWRRRALLGALLATTNRQAEVTRALIDSLRHFQSHVVWYAQSIGGSVGQRREAGDPDAIKALHDLINSMGKDWQLYWDSLEAREGRYEARTAALTKAYDELHERLSLEASRVVALTRRVEAARPVSAAEVPSAPAPPASDDGGFKYVAFEDRFRGSTASVRERLADYVPIFAGRTNVLDVGCGRGELLDLFHEHQITARGIDVNETMIDECRARGLAADRADALTFLSSLKDGSLGGLVAIQVVEHLEPAYLLQVLEFAHQKLQPGAPIVLETINAACWSAFFDAYIRDFTHARPFHPETLRYLVQASGFSTADVMFRSPVGDDDKLPELRIDPAAPALAGNRALADLVEVVNAHASRLNSQLFTFRDFAVVGRK